MLLRLFLIALFALCTVQAHAQEADPTATAIKLLDQQSDEFHAIDTAFNERTTSQQRQALQERAAAVRQAAADQVDTLTAELKQVDARVAQLGPVTPGVIETPDIRAERKSLERQRSLVDSAIKRGKLLGIDASQLEMEIARSNADVFSERMSQQTASPLTSAFWSELVQSLPRDRRRAEAFFAAEANALRQGAARGGLWTAAAGLLIALILLFPVGFLLQKLGRRYVLSQMPSSRIRRSALALWLAVVGALVPALAVIALVQGLRAGGMIADVWRRPITAFELSCIFAALIVALGGALLQNNQPSWRLVSVSDQAAHELRRWTFIAAGVTLASAVLVAIRDAFGASGPVRALADAIAALLYIALLTAVLADFARMRSRSIRQNGEESQEASAPMALLSMATWWVLIASVIALGAGYITLAYFMTRFLVWIAIVWAALYLLLIAIDDICTTLFRKDGGLAMAINHGLGIRISHVMQFGVALSAVLRVALILFAASLVLFPFGSNIAALFALVDQLEQGITIGQITIAPAAVVRAVITLMIGLFLVRVVQRWLISRYLPVTELDSGARNSIAMVARYSGLLLVGLWAVAALGVGLDRIGLLLSALSVGIGFGLQAITQNFVSGLILLAERPVKIGDWVKIGDQEGDVKRISVRATEIEIADRSTLIVPNSELITKSIVNKTLADPLGRIQLQFSVPIGSDVAQVRDHVAAIYAAHPAVLDEPKPSLFIDSITDGRINFNGFAYVASPRAAYAARSDLLFSLLSELPDRGIELGTTPQQFHLINAPAPGTEGIL